MSPFVEAEASGFLELFSGNKSLVLVSSGGGHGTPLQFSCLENPMDRGAWRATGHRVAKSRTWLSDWAMVCRQAGTRLISPIIINISSAPNKSLVQWDGTTEEKMRLNLEFCLKWRRALRFHVSFTVQWNCSESFSKYISNKLTCTFNISYPLENCTSFWAKGLFDLMKSHVQGKTKTFMS